MILRRNECHFQTTEQLGARNRDDAEVEEDAEQSSDRDFTNDRCCEDRATNEEMDTDVGQALILDIDQTSFFAGRMCITVFRKTSNMGNASYRCSTDPR